MACRVYVTVVFSIYIYMNNLFQNKYRVTSTRLQWHEYDGGAYFVTVCTGGKIHYFGEIADGEIKMTAIGQYAHDNLQNITAHYPYAEIPMFVVMPNHVHAIIFINNTKLVNKPQRRHVLVEPRRATALQRRMTDIANMQGWLSVVVGGFKSAITKYARQHGLQFAWQPRFYDHVIRNHHEINHIAEYIGNNVTRWDLDELNGE